MKKTKAKFVFCDELEPLKKANYTYKDNFEINTKKIYVFLNDGNITKLKTNIINKLIYTNKLFL